MKHLMALALLAWVTPLCEALELPPPATSLTPQEVAEGWILLFDGKSTMGWNAPNGSKWTVCDGLLAPQADTLGLLVTTSRFRNYEMKVQYIARTIPLLHPPEQNERRPTLLYGCAHDGGRVDKRGFWYELVPVIPPPPGVERRATDTGWTDLRLTVLEKDGGLEYKGDFRTRSGDANGSNNGKLTNCGSEGHIGLRGNGVVFRSIKLRPLEARPLFNGKDLEGWKEAEGSRARFVVSREGWLSVPGGPSELQTVRRWQDFVLQLEGRNGAIGLRRPSGPEVRVPGQDRARLTVAVHGDHLAVWVNGQQTRDERIVKGEKGPLGLFGQDAEFRNIRLTELTTSEK